MTASPYVPADAPPTVDPPPRVERSPEESDPYRGARGHTTIAETAVARIARHAIEEDAAGLGRAVSDRGPGRGPLRGQGPRVDVRVDGSLVTARVRLAVVYPEPVREVAARVRERVRDRVQDLTGLTVRQVDVEVAGLERPGAGPGRREVR